MDHWVETIYNPGSNHRRGLAPSWPAGCRTLWIFQQLSLKVFTGGRVGSKWQSSVSSAEVRQLEVRSLNCLCSVAGLESRFLNCDPGCRPVWVWSEFGDSPNSLQTHMFSVFFVISLFLWKRGMSFAPSSYFLYISFFFGGKEEWVWSEFGDFPNSLQTHF